MEYRLIELVQSAIVSWHRGLVRRQDASAAGLQVLQHALGAQAQAEQIGGAAAGAGLAYSLQQLADVDAVNDGRAGAGSVARRSGRRAQGQAAN